MEFSTSLDRLLGSFLPGIYVAVFLYLPIYYKGQIKPVLEAVVDSRAHLGAVMAPVPDEAHDGREIVSPDRTRPETPSSLTIPVSKDSDVETEWESFVSRCEKEWAVISASAFAFILACPAALQAFSEPITRSFTFVAILQALCAIACSMTLIIHFRNFDARLGRFAKALFRNMGKPTDSKIASELVVFSLPAVALCWGAVAFVGAFVSSVWHGNHGANSNDATTIGIVPQVMITILGLVDLGSVCWIILTFRKARHRGGETA